MMQKHTSEGHNRRFEFNRDQLGSGPNFSFIGEGELGGKASGLAFIYDTLTEKFPHSMFPGITVNIPKVTVLTTQVFEEFMKQNSHLRDIALSDKSDERIADAFIKGDFPYRYVGDLRALVKEHKTPLAIRSSSMLEDAMFRPFAGIFETKMIPNNQPDEATRFKKLLEAIKFVWASTYFRAAKDYISTMDRSIEEEKMALIIQEVVGEQYGDRYYPILSGVGKSFNFYPFGRAKPEEGVVLLGLGLGKTIVDGGLCWSYVPKYPRVPPPVANAGELMDITQKSYWAVNLGKTSRYDPVHEAEFLVESDLKQAESDGTIRWVASTYDGSRDRLLPGVGHDGPRVIDFAPVLDLELVKVNKLIQTLLEVCEEAADSEVEIEFAMTFDRKDGVPARLGFLQIRPMVVSREPVEVSEEELNDTDKTLAASEAVLGNGEVDTITDVVYVRPGSFEAKHTPSIAREVAEINRSLRDENRPYLLIGFGRWGSSDPWLGIPVNWSQIAGAKVMVEATLPGMNVEPSQGSHFFHNLSSFEVSYFFMHHTGERKIDWSILDRLDAVQETEFVRHVRFEHPLKIKVDGRTGRGTIQHDG